MASSSVPSPLPFPSTRNHHRRRRHSPLQSTLRPPPLVPLSSPHTPNSTSLLLPPAPPATTPASAPPFCTPHTDPPGPRPYPQTQTPGHEEDGGAHQLRDLLHLAVRHGDVELGRAVHATIVKNYSASEGGEEAIGGGGEECRLFNGLISMYIKAGRLTDARGVFELMPRANIVSHTLLMSAYAKSGQEEESVRLFLRMRMSGIEPNDFCFVAVLTSCIRSSNLKLGLALQGLVTKSDYGSDVYVMNALMGLYVKCGQADDAVRLLGEMESRDASSWNTVISGMVKDARYDEAFELFMDMRDSGFWGDKFTLSSVLTAAVEGFYRAEGEGIYAHAIKLGLESDSSVSNALLSFYTKFGRMEDIAGIFHRMPTRDVISWSQMITGYMEFGHVESAVNMFNMMPERNCISYNALLAGLCLNGEGFKALLFFRKMIEDGRELSDFTLTSALNACALVSEEENSKQIQALVLKVGCKSNAWVDASLLDMCVRCNRLDDAQRMLSVWSHRKSLSVAWTSLICGLTRCGCDVEALTLFNRLVKEEGMDLMDEIALASVIGVFGALGFTEIGKQMHCYIIKSRSVFDVGVPNSILSMYSKCGNIDDALTFFRLMSVRDIVSWNTLITAYIMHRQGDAALATWKEMERYGIKPDHVSFVLILLACKHTDFESVDVCRSLFASMTSCHGIKQSEEHYGSLVHVLGHWKCFDEAEKVIKEMPFKPGALIWKALLDNCRQHSNLKLGREAVQHILEMQPPDPSTYVLVSNIYSASGRWHCSEKIREEMRDRGIIKNPAQSWTIHQNAVHSFYARDRSHPQNKDIYAALDILILECMKAGYVPDTTFVLHEVEEYQKNDFLFYHSAKLAIAHQLITTTPGRSISAAKNIRLCGDCHSFMKYVSIVTRREIRLRDNTGFHFFSGGKCSCRDHW